MPVSGVTVSNVTVAPKAKATVTAVKMIARFMKKPPVYVSFLGARIVRRSGVTHKVKTGGEQHIAKKAPRGHVGRETWDRIAAALKRHAVELPPEADEHCAGVRWLRTWARRPQNW
jgi:hypothetical protein